MDETECHILSNESEQCSVVNIRHQYHVHGTDPDLHRMIGFIDTAPAVLPATQCFVQYWFESSREHIVPIKAHGNSKVKTESYCRTHTSTLNALKDQKKCLLLKGAVAAVYASEGSMMQANSLGKLPHDREQVTNIR